jgi:hypothetical protein
LRPAHGYAKSEPMPTEQTSPKAPGKAAAENQAPPKRPLSPAAERALTEAAARRAERNGKTADQPREIQGRDGPDPTRYGDWEIKGLTSDF